ncbi:MAG: hypothetical protein IPJ46_07665 [Anaerolineales bacterium]|nr:hypothetical protein [Anaerolineales bacterium]
MGFGAGQVLLLVRLCAWRYSVGQRIRGYNLGLFYALMGIAFLSGGLILKRYLNENPRLWRRE